MALNQESYKAILAQNISTTAQASWGSTKKNNFFFFFLGFILFFSYYN